MEVEVKLNYKQSKKISLCKNCISNDKKEVHKRLQKREEIIGNLFLAMADIDRTKEELVREFLQNKNVDYAIYSGDFELILPD
ncbi:hypothetical protein [Fodinibius sp.]|uniref:hypothetical protein n=1 Tax=Fodinibius sp. TaxID=1872440 RepID=UPI002ACDE0F2|nr:hypothetical protein [Fodinibius sp.]MDZ7658603.1 hypothetical protein [Fodinibius sp.]